MAYALRPMEAADLQPVAAIAAASREAPQWPPSTYASYFASPAQPPVVRTALVAVDEETIPGFACATLILDGQENLCQLDTLAVHPDHRRQGVGAALLRALLSWAAHNGARHFSLEVRASNAPAIALYQRLGLRLEGRRPRYYAHPEEDALLLGISVTAGTP